MDLIDILTLGRLTYKFGTKKVGSKVVGDYGITGNLNEILKLVERNSIALESHYLIKNLIKIYEENYNVKDDNENILTSEDHEDLKQFYSVIFSFIFVALKDKIVFPAYSYGDLNFQKLYKGAKRFFISKIWKNMQNIEKKDMEDCVKCLLTENWTPAGVMAMRAIESAVREYYFKLTNQRKTQWWKILEELKTNQNADQDLVKELDYIREHIRNPLAHPEDRIENHAEAEEAFLHAKKILTKIYS